jgi:hypothetical protein
MKRLNTTDIIRQRFETISDRETQTMKGSWSMLHRQLVFLFVLLLGSAAAPSVSLAQTQLSGSGKVEYRLVHKFHKIVGVSKAMAVRGTIDGSGLKLMARAQVGTFDSENANRDSHMMETVEGEKYPWVMVRAAVPNFKLPTNGTATVKVQAAVELHGVTVTHPIDIKLETKDGIHFKASFEFDESLTGHKIERPSLMFIPVDDLITIVGSADVTASS